MRSYMLAILGMGVMLGAGCASHRMTLKRIDQDMPSALVEKYNGNAAPYVDEGKAWCLPLLLSYEEHVAKTDQGFNAYQGGSLGLGLLLSETAYADFDAKGTLVKKEKASSLLTGLLLSTHGAQAKEDDTIKKADAWSILWGAIGFSEHADGAKRLSLLWIPIPICRGNATR